jgi:hypothetical protein
MSHSIVIPVGTFSFFIHANIENIYETTDPATPLDIIFVTSRDVEPHIQKHLDLAVKKYREVRVLNAPFNSGSNHLELLDWAIRQPLNQWMITQHSDVFWGKEGWLPAVEKEMKKDHAAICPPNYQFTFNENRIPIIGDTFGAYRRKPIIKKDWSFQWNHYSDESVSEKARALIDSGKIKRISGKKYTKGDFLDGSVIMSLEMIAEDPNMIKTINVDGMNHLLAFFRICDSIKWNSIAGTLDISIPFLQEFGGCTKELWIDAIARYSFLTSLIFDKSEVKNPLPWSLLEKISADGGINLNGGSSVCEWVAKYSKVKKEDTIGMDTLGIKKINFTNKEYNF